MKPHQQIHTKYYFFLDFQPTSQHLQPTENSAEQNARNAV